MRALVGLYVGWRLIRAVRPLLCSAVLIAGVFALAAHGHARRSAASTLERGAAAAIRGLPHAFGRAFHTPHQWAAGGR